MTKIVKLGIIGCGAIARQYHIPALKQVSHAVVWAVSDALQANAEQAALTFGIPAERTFLDAESLLRMEEIDGVLILTPNFTHLPLVKLAASYGKHIFIQKPMAKNSDECKEMIEACEKGNVKLFASFMHRYLPEVEKARQYIQEGYLGKVEMARIRNAPGATSTVSKWFYDKDLVGGGAVMDIGVHGIDLVRYLIGDIDRVLFAKLDMLKESVETGGETVYATSEDQGLVVYETKNNCTVSHEISWNHRSPVDRFSMEIYGSEGSIVLRNAMGPLSIYSEKLDKTQGWLVPELPYSPFGQKQHQSFIDMIANGLEPSPSAYDGLRAVEVVESIYRVAEGK